MKTLEDMDKLTNEIEYLSEKHKKNSQKHYQDARGK